MSKLRLSVIPTAGPAAGCYRLVARPGSGRGLKQFLRFCHSVSTVSEVTAHQVLELAAWWILHCAEEGRTCDLGPLGRSRLAFRGTYRRQPERILDRDVSLNISFLLAPAIKRAVRAFGDELIREEVPVVHDPSIKQVRSMLSDDGRWHGDRWQGGSALLIHGAHLKFDRHREDEGVFVCSPGHADATRLETYVWVYPRSILASMPAPLAGAGDLQLEVRARHLPTDERPVRARYHKSLQEAIPELAPNSPAMNCGAA